MKFQYLVDDLADVLTEYYIRFRDVHPNSQKRILMKHHIKQAMVDTFKYMYDPVDDVWSIDVWDFPQFHTYTLGHDVIYDREISTSMIQDIKRRLFASIENTEHTIDNSDDVINIHCVPFDEFAIKKQDIIGLLDLDCV